MIHELEKARAFKAKLQSGQACLGAQVTFLDPSVAEILGRAGFEWLVVDTEHSSHGPQTIRAMLQAAAHTAAVLIARPVRLDPDEIRRYLDLGSPGVLCPFINTAQEAEQLVRACRYPPAGTRGYGPRRAGVYGFDSDEYFHHANEAMICIPIIESKTAIENIDAIVRTDGIDGVCIGPMDLSISLGCYRQFQSSTFLDAVEIVRQACHKNHKAMGQGCQGLDHAIRCRDLGDTLLFVGDDDGFLADEASRHVQALRAKTP